MSNYKSKTRKSSRRKTENDYSDNSEHSSEHVSSKKSKPKTESLLKELQKAKSLLGQYKSKDKSSGSSKQRPPKKDVSKDKTPNMDKDEIGLPSFITESMKEGEFLSEVYFKEQKRRKKIAKLVSKSIGYKLGFNQAKQLMLYLPAYLQENSKKIPKERLNRILEDIEMAGDLIKEVSKDAVGLPKAVDLSTFSFSDLRKKLAISEPVLIDGNIDGNNVGSNEASSKKRKQDVITETSNNN